MVIPSIKFPSLCLADCTNSIKKKEAGNLHGALNTLPAKEDSTR